MRLIKKANLRIKGTGNEFVCPKDVHNELLKYGNVRIDGNNNKINIGGPNYLKFTDIKIFGNNNTLILPPGCYGKLNLEIRTSDAVVTVGHKTGFMGTDIILEEKGSRVIIGDDCMFAKETRLVLLGFSCRYRTKNRTSVQSGQGNCHRQSRLARRRRQNFEKLPCYG